MIYKAKITQGDTQVYVEIIGNKLRVPETLQWVDCPEEMIVGILRTYDETSLTMDDLIHLKL